MSDKLKKFVTEHRQEFDTSEPGNELWKKIDARMDVKNPSRISSKRLSKFKYLGFSASVLIVALCLIARNFMGPSAGGLAQSRTDSAVNHPGQDRKANPNKLGSVASETTEAKEANDLSGNKSESYSDGSRDQGSVSSDGVEQGIRSGYDSVSTAVTFEAAVPDQKKIKTEIAITEKKESERTGNNKKPGLYIPEEPEKMNTYSGTLYQGSSLCDILRAYRYPGKVSLDKVVGTHVGKKGYTRTTVRTISCSRLESIATIKAVWLKGKTDQELTLSVGKKFKNIVLVKPDGRKLSPEAISHYYPGLGAISPDTGKSFDMVFKDKVELILFFKDAEEGDKIVIDGTVEAVVKGQP